MVRFPIEREGSQPDPPLVTISAEDMEVRIAATDSDYQGRSYAVFINGHLNVNETV